MTQNYPLEQATVAGVSVVVNHDPWVPGVALNLWYDVGSADETAGHTGLAHLFEHLMFTGSRHVGSGEHLAVLQAQGGDANATTSFDRTDYEETVPAGALDLALWLEADRLSSLLDAVTQTNLDTQRAVVQEEKRQRYDNVPYGDAFAQLMDLSFGADHAYGHTPIGSMADLDAATLTDVHGFFRAHYCPANLTMALSGAIDLDAATTLVERYFGDIAPGAPPVRPPYQTLPPLTGRPGLTLDRDVPQDAVYVVWRTPAVTNAASDALSLGLAILTDGLAARLHQHLVVPGLADVVDGLDLGLARGNSLTGVVATCADASPAALEEAILTHVAAMIARGVTPAELDRAKVTEERDWLAGLAAVDGRAETMAESAVTFGDAGRVNTYLDRLAAVTPDDVRSAVATYLAPDNAATLIYRSRA